MKGERAKSRASVQILNGWKEIANYLGRGVRTVQRYERLFGLPVRRPAGKPWGSVVATPGDIDAWVARTPVRDGLRLMHPPIESSSSTWANIQEGMAEMARLAKEMADLRLELRNSVRLLRQSIQGVQGEVMATWANYVDERTAKSAKLFNLLSSDSGSRKAS